MQVLNIPQTTVRPDRSYSTPLYRAANLLQAVLPYGWRVEIADTVPALPTLHVWQPLV
jgi:hypothetical protein